MKRISKLLACSALLGILATAGCGGGGGTYWLTLDYPNGIDLGQIVEVEVFALKTSTDATCGALLGGSAPSDFGTPKITYFPEPNPADASIKGLGSGEWVFFARAKNGSGVFLHGCATAKVGEDITISMTEI